DQKIDRTVAAEFLHLKKPKLLNHWFNRLEDRENKTRSLFQDEEEKFFPGQSNVSLYQLKMAINKEQPINECVLLMLLKEGTLATLCVKSMRIDDKLRPCKTPNSSPTSSELL